MSADSTQRKRAAGEADATAAADSSIPEPTQEAQAQKPTDEATPQEEDAFEQAFQHLRKWADTKEATYALLHAKREARKQRYATALS